MSSQGRGVIVTVSDASTSKGIEGAMVVSNAGDKLMTDIDGMASFPLTTGSGFQATAVGYWGGGAYLSIMKSGSCTISLRPMVQSLTSPISVTVSFGGSSAIPPHPVAGALSPKDQAIRTAQKAYQAAGAPSSGPDWDAYEDALRDALSLSVAVPMTPAVPAVPPDYAVSADRDIALMTGYFGGWGQFNGNFGVYDLGVLPVAAYAGFDKESGCWLYKTLSVVDQNGKVLPSAATTTDPSYPDSWTPQNPPTAHTWLIIG